MLMSESVSACPCFIAASWWMAGLISDECELSWAEVRDKRDMASASKQSRRLVISRPPPAQTQTQEGGQSVCTPAPGPGRAREIVFFIIDKWLECPGRALTAQCLGQKYLHWNEKCFYCIPIYFCERFVIPLLFMLYSLLILPIWVPALTGPVRPAVLWCGV